MINPQKLVPLAHVDLPISVRRSLKIMVECYDGSNRDSVNAELSSRMWELVPYVHVGEASMGATPYTRTHVAAIRSRSRSINKQYQPRFEQGRSTSRCG